MAIASILSTRNKRANRWLPDKTRNRSRSISKISFSWKRNRCHNRFFFLLLPHFTFHIDGWRSSSARTTFLPIFGVRIRFQCEFQINEFTWNDFAKNKFETIFAVLLFSYFRYSMLDWFELDAYFSWLFFSSLVFYSSKLFNGFVPRCVHGELRKQRKKNVEKPQLIEILLNDKLSGA